MLLLSAAPSASASVSFTLPAPTGRYQVGTTTLHLIDRGRADPWKPELRRELMVSVWYPARNADRYPLAHWTTPALVPYLNSFGFGQVDWTSATTSAHVDAPALGRFPTILYSPGYGAPRSSATVQAQDLASHGYTVVTVDPTYETVVEFPDRVEQPVPQDTPTASRTSLDARVADIRYVLTALANHCDADGKPIPPMDLRRVGAFG
ncbi:lipase, partial [Kibdelosporangium lantanae]